MPNRWARSDSWPINPECEPALHGHVETNSAEMLIAGGEGLERLPARGAGGGAPCGPRHGQYRQGVRTNEPIAERRLLAELGRLVRETLSEPCLR